MTMTIALLTAAAKPLGAPTLPSLAISALPTVRMCSVTTQTCACLKSALPLTEAVLHVQLFATTTTHAPTTHAIPKLEHALSSPLCAMTTLLAQSTPAAPHSDASTLKKCAMTATPALLILAQVPLEFAISLRSMFSARLAAPRAADGQTLATPRCAQLVPVWPHLCPATTATSAQ